MTTLTLDENQAAFQIRSYQPGKIQINNTFFTKSLIVSPNQLIEDWPPQSVDELSAQMLEPIMSVKPDILLIGTGETLIFLAVEVYGELINRGIGVEIMDTRAACRTFNALSAENRNVMAALIIK